MGIASTEKLLGFASKLKDYLSQSKPKKVF